MFPDWKTASCQSVLYCQGVLSTAIPALARACALITRHCVAFMKSMRCGTSCTP
jgi:hypothetical protein